MHNNMESIFQVYPNSVGFYFLNAFLFDIVHVLNDTENFKIHH